MLSVLPHSHPRVSGVSSPHSAKVPVSFYDQYAACNDQYTNISESTLSVAQNHLIELLPRTARLRLLAICEPVELVMAEVLSEVGIAARYVYFPTKSFIS